MSELLGSHMECLRKIASLGGSTLQQVGAPDTVAWLESNGYVARYKFATALTDKGRVALGLTPFRRPAPRPPRES